MKKMYDFLFRACSLFAVLTTYDDESKLEDVMKQVLITNPAQNPFVTGIGTASKATGTTHEWLEDSIAAATYNPIPEGATISYGSVTAPSRVTNYTQIFVRDAQVSSTQKWIKHGGIANMVDYQQMKAIEAITEDIEKAALTGSLASGNEAGASARRMGGALNFVTTNATAVTSQTLTESFYNSMNELAWDNKGVVDEVFVGMRLKRVISSYTGGTTKQTMADEKRLINKVDFYESDLGVQKIYPSRYMPSGEGTAAILGIESDKWAIAVGEAVHILPKDEVAQTTHGTNTVARGELTLEARGQSHCFKATGLSEKFVV